MIQLKSEKEISVMRENGKMLSRVMEELRKKVEPGIETIELDRLAESLILDLGAKPGFKNYQGFPNALCVSINEEIVHGVPSDRILEEGDIVSLDLGLLNNGFYSDMAITVPVGNISKKTQKLVDVTRKSLNIAIEAIKIGGRFGDIGAAVEEYAEKMGYGVVRDLCGHGIGSELHEDPEIVNYGVSGTGDEIKVGMVFCLEPMLTLGDYAIERGEDGFVYRTTDRSLSAHSEHMIAITEDGVEVLTK